MVRDDGADFRRELLIAMIESLPDQQRYAMSMRYEHNMRVTEIAAVLGVSIPAVRRFLRMAFTRIDPFLGKPGQITK